MPEKCVSAVQAGYMELAGAKKDADCSTVNVPGGVSSDLGCCNLFKLAGGAPKKFSCGTCKFVTAKTNPLFSFLRGMLPEKLRRPERLKRISWNRLTREKRRKVAIATGISPKIADVWSRIRWHEIPEGWKDALISNLGAARNPMQKKRKKKSTPRRRPAGSKRRRTSVRRPGATRRKNARTRRRNRVVSFPFPVTPAQKTKLKRFLHRVTGRRVKFK